MVMAVIYKTVIGWFCYVDSVRHMFSVLKHKKELNRNIFKRLRLKTNCA